MDIAAHITAQTGTRKPKDNADLFVILSEYDIIPKDLARRLGQFVGFRNILTHMYLMVDVDKVYDNLQNDLSDLVQFRAAMTTWLESQSA